MLGALPGDYVHLGGDEVEGLDHEAYVAFMWEACTLALRRGKRPIVWEEAGVAKLPEGTIVQHWSDAAPARKAVEQGLPLIMSPAPHTYLDQKYDADDRAGLDLGGCGRGPRRLRLGPGAVIEGADVLGVEAALWSETTETRDDVDYMVFPRLPAVAEVGWSGERDWDGLPRAASPPTGRCCPTRGVNFHRSAQIDWD